jgi:hypothetical protein
MGDGTTKCRRRELQFRRGVEVGWEATFSQDGYYEGGTRASDVSRTGAKTSDESRCKQNGCRGWCCQSMGRSMTESRQGGQSVFFLENVAMFLLTEHGWQRSSLAGVFWTEQLGGN